MQLDWKVKLSTIRCIALKQICDSGLTSMISFSSSVVFFLESLNFWIWKHHYVHSSQKKSLFISLLCELLSSRVPLRLYPAPWWLLWPEGGAAFSPTGKWSAPRSHPSRLCLRTPGWPSPCPAQLAGTAALSVGTWPYALKPRSTWSTWVCMLYLLGCFKVLFNQVLHPQPLHRSAFHHFTVIHVYLVWKSKTWL